MKVLHFPADVPVGHVSAYRGDTCLLSVPACGDVTVPSDAVISLSPDSPVRGVYMLASHDLDAIYIRKKQGTDEDLRHVAHLTGLRELNCSKSHAIGDAGIAHVAPLRDLVALDLYWTAVTDAALVHIGRMHQLRHLHLGLTRVSGPGLVHLARLQRLVRLSLENTDVDDSAVPVLSTLSSLRSLVLWGTRFTTRGLAALRAALPACEIFMRDPGRRVAAECRQAAMTRILARRLGWTSLEPETKIVEWRGPDGLAHELKQPVRPGDDPDATFLMRWAFDIDLHVVAADGRDVWIPWLRKRGNGRRRIEVAI